MFFSDTALTCTQKCCHLQPDYSQGKQKCFFLWQTIHTDSKSVAIFRLTIHTVNKSVIICRLTVHTESKSAFICRLTSHTESKSVIVSRLTIHTKMWSFAGKMKAKVRSSIRLTICTKSRSVVPYHTKNKSVSYAGWLLTRKAKVW